VNKEVQDRLDRRDHLDLWVLLGCPACVEMEELKERRVTQV